MNPLFEKNQIRWTWRSPNYETFNEIDYIMADKHQNVKNGEAMNQDNFGSDHRMVRCRVQIDTKRERRRLFYHNPVLPLNVDKFRIKLKNRHSTLEEETDGNINETTIKDLNNNTVKPLAAAAKDFSSPCEGAKKSSKETIIRPHGNLLRDHPEVIDKLNNGDHTVKFFFGRPKAHEGNLLQILSVQMEH